MTGAKQYFIPKNVKSHWHECRRLCEEFGMEFARFEFQSEAEYIFSVTASYGPASYVLYVDGVVTTPMVKTGWYWVKSRFPIDYLPSMYWTAGQPNNFQNDQHCLSLDKVVGVVGWNDVPCYGNANARAVGVGPRRFLCQIKHENFIHRIINNTGK